MKKQAVAFALGTAIMIGTALAISWPNPPAGQSAGGELGSLLKLDTTNNRVGVGTASTPASATLEVDNGVIKAAGGLVHEVRASDPGTPAAGQVWLRSDINP